MVASSGVWRGMTSKNGGKVRVEDKARREGRGGGVEDEAQRKVIVGCWSAQSVSC